MNSKENEQKIKVNLNIVMDSVALYSALLL